MDKNSKMILLEDSIKVVNAIAGDIALSTETVDIRQASGRTLASDALSKLQLPPFNKSAMDGFAVMADDVRDEYKVLEFIPAGSVPSMPLSAGCATKVMTGAPVPEGAGKVVMVEQTTETQGAVKVNDHAGRANICFKGEDIQVGDCVLKAPSLLGALEIANLISCGITEVDVFADIKVAVVSTGDEIVDDASKIAPGKIMNANGPLLAGLCEKNSLKVTSVSVAKDNRKDTAKAIADAMDAADIVILSGGVSMGDLDFVDTAMGDLGLKVHFNRVAVKPGKPMTFASKDSKMVFGLPGNPVSVYLMFHLFVLPAARAICGIETDKLIELPLSEDFKRKKTDRALFAPGKIITDGKISQVKYHGSAHLIALMKADGFFLVEKGVGSISADEKVKFINVS